MPFIILAVMLLVLIGVPFIITLLILDLVQNGVSFWPVFWLALVGFGIWCAGSTGNK